MAIRFHFQKKIPLIQRRSLKEFISRIFEIENKALSQIDFIFCDNPYILNINRSFLNHDYFTDIISFDLSEPQARGITAEIYISTDMVETNAIEFQASFSQELHRVIFHGVLHLCGYKDKSRGDLKEMRRKEDFYLKAYAVFLKSDTHK